MRQSHQHELPAVETPVKPMPTTNSKPTNVSNNRGAYRQKPKKSYKKVTYENEKGV